MPDYFNFLELTASASRCGICHCSTWRSG